MCWIELQRILQTLAGELENQAAEVAAVPTDAPSEPEIVNMGEPSSGIVDVKINLDALKTFGQWLYGRLVGTTTKVKFEYGEVKFEFEGRDRDLTAGSKAGEAWVNDWRCWLG